MNQENTVVLHFPSGNEIKLDNTIITVEDVKEFCAKKERTKDPPHTNPFLRNLTKESIDVYIFTLENKTVFLDDEQVIQDINISLDGNINIYVQIKLAHRVRGGGGYKRRKKSSRKKLSRKKSSRKKRSRKKSSRKKRSRT